MADTKEELIKVLEDRLMAYETLKLGEHNFGKYMQEVSSEIYEIIPTNEVMAFVAVYGKMQVDGLDGMTMLLERWKVYLENTIKKEKEDFIANEVIGD